MIASYQAVIFDLDGVLTYTEPAIFRILQQLVARYEIVLTEIDNRALFGIDYTDTARYLIQKYCLSVSQEHLVQMLDQAVMERIEQEMEPAPGGQELLENLAKRGIRLGLASNSPSLYVRRILDGLGLSSYLPIPVGRDDVARGKPFPDPYLEACRRAGANPARSIAIEDSPVGARAALAAGMDCILIAQATPSELAGRVMLMPDLASVHSTFLAS